MKQNYYLIYRPHSKVANCLTSSAEKETTFLGPRIQPGITHGALSSPVPSVPSDGNSPQAFSVFHDLGISEMHRLFVFQNVPRFKLVWHFFMVTFRRCIFSRKTTKEMCPSPTGIWEFFPTWFIDCTNTQVHTTPGTGMRWGRRWAYPTLMQHTQPEGLSVFVLISRTVLIVSFTFILFISFLIGS